LNWHTILGIASGVVLLCGNIPYISSIRRGETRPNRVTWGIWTTIGFILLGSSYSLGATNTLWLQIAQVISQVIITFYAFKYSRGQWYFLDRVCLAGASLSLVFWWQSGSPFVALLMNIAMDILGAVPTIKKIYYDPKSEDLTFWVLSFISAVLNLFAIENFSIAFIAFPVYLFILNVVILLLLTRRVVVR
jgi:hypothetical protein